MGLNNLVEKKGFLVFSIQTYIASKLVKMLNLDLSILLQMMESGGLYQLVLHVNMKNFGEGKYNLESKNISRLNFLWRNRKHDKE